VLFWIEKEMAESGRGLKFGFAVACNVGDLYLQRGDDGSISAPFTLSRKTTLDAEDDGPPQPWT
jgi:hypothetical protein